MIHVDTVHVREVPRSRSSGGGLALVMLGDDFDPGGQRVLPRRVDASADIIFHEVERDILQAVDDHRSGVMLDSEFGQPFRR